MGLIRRARTEEHVIQEADMGKNISRRANEIADRAFELLLGRDIGAALKGFAPLLNAEMPDISYEAAGKRAAACRELIAECDEMLAGGVGHDDEMLLGIVRFNAEGPIEEHRFYWNKFDYEPFFNLLTLYLPDIRAIRCETEEYAMLKARLLEGCAKLAIDMLAKAREQFRRGILMAKPLVRISVGAFEKFVYDDVKSSPYILEGNGSFDIAPYRARAEEAVRRMSEGCRELVEFLGGEYYSAAPEEVGLWQYPDGAEYYNSCIRQKTTLGLSGEEVFELGRRLREDIEARMAAIRRGQGYDCSREEFSEAIMRDPDWVMDTPEEFGRRLNGCVEKMRPLMDRYFGIHTDTPCAAVRVSPELEPYYANGIYTPASPTQEIKRGEYHYNGLNMRKKNPLKTESLSYHELIPGHHYQFSVVQELKDLHPLCRAVQATAYNEGWAEYAAAFAGEIGLYSSPLSEYGRLEMDLYITNFLTIDAGLNSMKIPVEEMCEFMRPYLPDYPGDALKRQLMRIAEGMPAFALAYKLGSVKMQEYRREAQKKLGEAFDIREYHTVVLEWGALPLELLKQHIDHYVRTKLEK